MKIFSTIVATLALAGLLLTFSPKPVSAGTTCGTTEIETSFSWGGKKCFPRESKDGTVNNPIFIALLGIFNFLAIGVGIVVTGGIVYGGIIYAASNGNATTSQKGITVIVNSVMGLLLFIFMYATLNFLVPGGLFK